MCRDFLDVQRRAVIACDVDQNDCCIDSVHIGKDISRGSVLAQYGLFHKSSFKRIAVGDCGKLNRNEIQGCSKMVHELIFSKLIRISWYSRVSIRMITITC